jgi:undecaprenyl-diphosphatase
VTVFQGFILGLIQGISEFLPISSSGHLVLFQKLFGISANVVTFDVAVHVATLIAVFFVFWKDIWEMIKHPLSKLTLLVVVGTIPAVVIGLLFKKQIDSLFQSGATTGLEFILTAVVLWYAEGVKSSDKKLGKTSYLDATIIGVAQGIAILPAVSRSGFTIAGALFRGLNREFAAKFSFLLSIPAILGAAVLGMKDVVSPGQGVETAVGMWPLLIGMIAAGISGYISIKFMLKLLTRKGSMKIFACYVFVVGALILIDQLFFRRFFPGFIN